MNSNNNAVCRPPMKQTSDMSSVDWLQLFKRRLELYEQQQNEQKPHPSTRELKKTTQCVQLSRIKADLGRAFKTIEELKSKRDQIQANINQLSNDEWMAELSAIREQKTELQMLISQFKSPGFQVAAQQKVTQRQVRRLRIQKRKVHTKQMKMSLIAKRQAIHANIDECLRLDQEAIRDAKDRSTAANRAEQILSGVTKKKAEAKRYVELINGLIELRRMRSVQTGRHNEADHREFLEKIGRLKDVWIDAIVNCEERELKYWLSGDDGSYGEWCRVLFGSNGGVADVENPVLRTEHDFGELLRIRNLWDQFIVPSDNPFGTSIPGGWVLPSSNPTEQWLLYREDWPDTSKDSTTNNE